MYLYDVITLYDNDIVDGEAAVAVSTVTSLGGPSPAVIKGNYEIVLRLSTSWLNEPKNLNRSKIKTWSLRSSSGLAAPVRITLQVVNFFNFLSWSEKHSLSKLYKILPKYKRG